jgi:hypothetical protein
VTAALVPRVQFKEQKMCRLAAEKMSVASRSSSHIVPRCLLEHPHQPFFLKSSHFSRTSRDLMSLLHRATVAAYERLEDTGWFRKPVLYSGLMGSQRRDSPEAISESRRIAVRPI